MEASEHILKGLGVVICPGTPPSTFNQLAEHAVRMAAGGYPHMVATDQLWLDKRAEVESWLEANCGGPQYSHWQRERGMALKAPTIFTGWLWGFSDRNHAMHFRMVFG